MLQPAPVLIHVHLRSWLGLMTSEPNGLTKKNACTIMYYTVFLLWSVLRPAPDQLLATTYTCIVHTYTLTHYMCRVSGASHADAPYAWHGRTETWCRSRVVHMRLDCCVILLMWTHADRHTYVEIINGRLAPLAPIRKTCTTMHY